MRPDIDVAEFADRIGIQHRGDGMVHCAGDVDMSIKKKHTMTYATGKYDTECCEHCLKKDCSGEMLRPCLSEITYREFIEVRSHLWKRVSDGEELCGILRDLDLPYRTLVSILRFGRYTGIRFKTGYPDIAVQKKLKKYLKTKRKNENDGM